MRHYATSRKVVGSELEVVNEFFSIYLILPAALGPGDYSASNINEYQKIILGRTARPARKADNFTAIYEPTIWDPQHRTTL
jgi:hypothetical protein